jgi:predicted O-methyltransferase YrrM
MMSENLAGYDLDQRKAHLTQARHSLPGPVYYAVLGWLHQILQPATYVEIGVQNGDSLLAARPDTVCIGIDPMPTPNKPLPANVRLFTMTSDAFFERGDVTEVLGGDHFSLAFIDGLHLFEQALLDFIHLERLAAPDSIIILHDCLPLDSATSERTRTTDFYSGDVWKLALCLRDMRPDLRMATIPTSPTGLCIVSGLDRHSTTLAREYDACVARYLGLGFDDYQMRALRMPEAIANTREAVTAYVGDVRAALSVNR